MGTYLRQQGNSHVSNMYTICMYCGHNIYNKSRNILIPNMYCVALKYKSSRDDLKKYIVKDCISFITYKYINGTVTEVDKSLQICSSSSTMVELIETGARINYL